MSNSQITSQLTRVTVPSISDGKFAEGIGRAFETINNNFKTIASLPFIQGVQGDSYTLISKDIWVEVNDTVSSVYYALTKEGAVLLNSIFESHLNEFPDTKKFQEGDSFDECKTNILGELSINGVSPIDSFFTEKIEDDKTVKELVNNKLYFYSVINNLDEEQDTYLGQYFYFIDYRITELGNAYQSEKLSKFTDFTGFYQYQPESETESEKYVAISIVPNLYYDKDKNDICWKYNGQETGISAIGPKGLDGKDADFKIVYVKYVNDTDNSGDILGYFDSVTKSIKYTSDIENCFCLVQIVNTTTNEDNTEVTSYVDSAFGEVHDGKAYWENSLKIGKLFNNQNITKYFCSMGNDTGEPTDIKNHPYYLAIPANLDRTNANDDSYKVGHVFSSSNNGNLILQKADNAFTKDAGQTSGSLNPFNGTQSNIFNITNYDVKIDKNLSIGETLGVTGVATIGSDLSVSGTATIKNGATIINGASINGKNQVGSIGLEVHGGIGGIGASIEGGRSRTSVGCTGLVVNGGLPNGSNPKRGLGIKVETGGVEISDDLSVGGTLDVTSTATVGNLEVTGNATISNDLTVTNSANIGALGVTGNATVGGTLDVTGTATVGNLGVTGNVGITGNLDVTSTATVGNLGVSVNATVGGDLGVTGDLNAKDIIGTGKLSIGGSGHIRGTILTIGDNSVSPEKSKAVITAYTPLNSNKNSSGAFSLRVHGSTGGGDSKEYFILSSASNSEEDEYNLGRIHLGFDQSDGLNSPLKNYLQIGVGGTSKNAAAGVFGDITSGIEIYSDDRPTASGKVTIKPNLIIQGPLTTNGKITGDSGIIVKSNGQGIHFYSKDGNNSDNNILIVDQDYVAINGAVAKLRVSNEIVVSSNGIYERSNGGKKDGYTYTLEDMITNNEGNVRCGGASNMANGIGAQRSILNRSAIQAFRQEGNSDGSQSYTGYQLYINPHGGAVSINARTTGISSTSTSNGSLVVKGGVGISENLNIGGSATIPGGATISGGATINGGATIYGRTILEDLALTKNASIVSEALTTEDRGDGLEARYRITSGGIISGVDKKTGFTLDQNVPVGTIFIVTGGAGSNRRFSNSHGWKPFAGGIYRVGKNDQEGNERDLYCICSPYKDQGWVGVEDYG